MIMTPQKWARTAGLTNKDIPMQLARLKEEKGEFETATTLHGLIDGYCDVRFVLVVLHFFGYDIYNNSMSGLLPEMEKQIAKYKVNHFTLMECYDEVCRSNASKFTDDFDSAKEAEKRYLSEGVDCYIDKVGDFYVIRREDGKVLKCDDYFEPDFSKLVDDCELTK